MCMFLDVIVCIERLHLFSPERSGNVATLLEPAEGKTRHCFFGFVLVVDRPYFKNHRIGEGLTEAVVDSHR